METVFSLHFTQFRGGQCNLLYFFWSCVHVACFTMNCQTIWDWFERDVWEEETGLSSLLVSPPCCASRCRWLAQLSLWEGKEKSKCCIIYFCGNMRDSVINCTPSFLLFLCLVWLTSVWERESFKSFSRLSAVRVVDQWLALWKTTNVKDFLQLPSLWHLSLDVVPLKHLLLNGRPI